MMRSMYSGVSGLRNHQTRMDVIGNNIANVNTTGYKKSRVVFKDAFYQVSRGASRPTTERGGTNPMAVGLGMTLASIDQIHTPAPTTTTNKTTDMAIDGNGYFAVNIGDKRYYTRAGAFDFDTDGKLVSTANGYQVQGWTTQRIVDPVTGDWTIPTSADPGGISLQSFKILEPNETTEMEFTGNLDSTTELTPANSEHQILSFTTVPTQGIFRLSIDGQTTGWINAAGGAAAIQTALEGLSNVGAGNVNVTANATGYDISFVGGLANTDVAQVQFVDDNVAFNGLPGTIGGTNTVPTIDFSGTPPTAGSAFTLTVNGTTTASIIVGADADETATNMQNALNAILPVGGATSATVAQAGGVYTITYDGDPGGATSYTAVAAFDGAGSTTATVAPLFNQLAIPTASDSIMTSRDVYDSLGNKRTVYFRFIKYNVDTSVPNSPVSNWACDMSLNPLFEAAPGYTPAIDLVNVDLGTAAPAENLPATGNRIIRVTGLNFDEMGKVIGDQPDPDPFTLTVDRDSIGANDITFEIDLNSINQYSGKSNAWAEYQNGYKQGNLTSYSIGTDGTIIGIYDNDETRSLARVALFTFENPAGLKQAGSSLFTESSNSGLANQGAPGEGGKGTIIPGSLEMSNVDLSEEFTDMIVTQRGFQANSRIITTSDEMLQELVNLKR